MANENKIPIFVSSAQYGLEDLRAELRDFLTEMGAMPLMSSEAGFPDQEGLPPYAQCLRVLEKSLIVIGIIDRRYGQKMDDWGPYTKYAGLSPTHAELRHAIANNKRLHIYVREDVKAFYELYRKNKSDFENLALPNGLDINVLKMFEEIKRSHPAPWIEGFSEVPVIKDSIRKRLISDLFQSLEQREQLYKMGMGMLIDTIINQDEETLTKIRQILSGEEVDYEKLKEHAIMGKGPKFSETLAKAVENNRPAFEFLIKLASAMIR